MKNLLNSLSVRSVLINSIVASSVIISSIVTTSVFWASSASAEIAIIVNKENTDELDANSIKRIFLGKTKGFPSAGRALPLDLPSGTETKDAFLSKVVGKSQSQYDAYWSKLMFTGKGMPPKISASESEVLGLVAKNPNTIGFIDATKVTADVRVVATF